jgi:glutamate synthase domain-containing protein 2
VIQAIRTKLLWAVLAATLVVTALGVLINPWWLIGDVVLVPLSLLGLWDYLQPRHSILRNYPLAGHLRFLLEDMGPELHQYVIENAKDGTPFNRDTRTLIYERAKSGPDKKPFGTELDVYEAGYTWLTHSMAPRPMPTDPENALRIHVGGPDCTKPYDASVLNISAMSFGALGGQAVRAMNKGAAMGGFAQVTGEGGISRYHREYGGDLIWQIGTGYFGCRNPDGSFSEELFERNATDDQVKMIEIKVSQGAKPGHGGILPGAKVTAEIAEARGVPQGVDCFSPTYHSAFSTPREMVRFIDRLRTLSGGKPVGFKLCVGRPVEFMAVVKAMLETGITPDFITVDGAEGGTGAAPLEFSDSLGTPLVEGLMTVHNTLVAANLRDRIRIAASGKMVTASAMAQSMALGADWCNSARAFMFAIGCIQSQRCHTNKCPVGVATQDPRLERALVVPDKADRVHAFHQNTVRALAELLAAMGLDSPSELEPHMVFKRISNSRVAPFSEIYELLEPGAFLAGDAPPRFQRLWDAATPESFRPLHPVGATSLNSTKAVLPS